ncbi:MAG: hypothetical protein Q9185_000821 [Variospora sp. 1 TL-2023]
MDCYAPTPIAGKGLIEEVHRKNLQRTIDGMRTEHMSFKGLLFTFLLAQGGYPGSYTTGEPITITSGAFSNRDANTHIFHSGTSRASGTLKTAGGRVIAATAVTLTLQCAIADAYSTLSIISFPGIHYRRDIAHRALSPSTSSSLPVAQSSSIPKTSGFTYASSGVSITNGNKFVSAVKPLVATTRISGSVATIVSFGGPFDLHLGGYPNGPCLVSDMDGVGKKARIAQRMKKIRYHRCNKLDVNTATEVVKGVVLGCKEVGCALVGGEMAEMGAIYREGECDLIGSATDGIGYGMASMPRKSDMREGLASSGCHSNGFSLVQKIVEKSELEYTDPASWAAKLTIGAALHMPTRIYVDPLLAAIEKVKGAAHTTGGGLLITHRDVYRENWQRS